jgi:hypothetical protein
MAHPPNAKTECCWPGQAWSKINGTCVGTPKCPTRFEARGDTCADLEAERLQREREAALAQQRAKDRERAEQQKREYEAEMHRQQEARSEQEKKAAEVRAAQEQALAEQRKVVDLGEVPSPLYPHRRLKVGAGLDVGVRCIFLLTSAAGGSCGYLMRANVVDFPVGNFHVNFTYNEARPSSFATCDSCTPNPATSSKSLGGGFGVDLGSMFMQLGGPTSPVSMAVRGQFDVVVDAVSAASSSSSSASGILTGGTLGLALPFAFGVSRVVSIDATIAGGLVAGAFPGNSNFHGGVGPYFQLAAGPRL